MSAYAIFLVYTTPNPVILVNDNFFIPDSQSCLSWSNRNGQTGGIFTRMRKRAATLAVLAASGLGAIGADASTMQLAGGYSVDFNFLNDGYYDSVLIHDYYSFSVLNTSATNGYALSASSNAGYSEVTDLAYFTVTLRANPGKAFSQLRWESPGADILYNALPGGAWATESFILNGTVLLSDTESGGNWGGYAPSHYHGSIISVSTNELVFSVQKQMFAVNNAGYGGSSGGAPSYVLPGKVWFNAIVQDAPQETVPEPETSFLLLLGLGLMWGVARREQTRSRDA